MGKMKFANNASATLAVSIIDTDLTVQVQSGYGSLFPSPSGGDWFMLTLEDNAANIEVMKCTARTGDLLTVVRAQDGTTARAFTNTVTRCELRDAKAAFEQMFQRSGDVMGDDLDLGGHSLKNGALGTDVTVPKASVFPVGMIVLWSGAIGAIPAGWKLCDGTNSTPDLRDKFVMGAGTTAVGATGGAASASPTTSAAGAHDHGGSVDNHVLTVNEMPAHHHRLWVNGGSGFGSAATNRFEGTDNVAIAGDADTGSSKKWLESNGNNQHLVEDTGGGQGHSHTVSAAVDHTHGVTVATVPPYYALAYIMFTNT